MNHLEHCAALEVEVERFAQAVTVVPSDTDVATCPGWRVGDVTEHLGLIHRWADQLVRRRSPVRISFEKLGLREGETNPRWICEGSRGLLETLRDADPEAPMYAWGADQHVRFWSRRQLHETLVHRMDVELAGGLDPEAPADVAIDAIDEFLANLAAAARFSPSVANLRGHGERLALRETETGTQWTITLHEDRFDIVRDHSPVDAEIAGPPVALLLAVYRRRPAGEHGVTTGGETALTRRWLENSALE